MALKMPKMSLNVRNMSLKKVQSLAWRYWMKSFRYIVILAFLWGVVHAGSVWYKNVYSAQIDDEQKAQEIELKKKRVQFRKDDFTAVNKAIEKKRVLFEQNGERSRDMFFPGTKQDQQQNQAAPTEEKVAEEPAPVTDESTQATSEQTTEGGLSPSKIQILEQAEKILLEDLEGESPTEGEEPPQEPAPEESGEAESS